MLRLLALLEAGKSATNGAKTWAARLISSPIAAASLSPPRPFSSSSPLHQSFFDRLSDVLTQEIVADSLVSRGYAVVDNALDADTCRVLRGEIEALKAAGLLRANATFLVKGGSTSKGSSSSSSSSEGDRDDFFRSPSLSNATLLEKRGIWETDSWGDAAVATAAPSLSSAAGGPGGGAKSLAALLSVLCPEHFSLSGPAILKAQLNDGLERGGREGGEEGGQGEEERGASSSSPSPSSPSSSSSSSSSSPSPSFPCFPLHFDSDESVDGRRVTAIFYVSEKKKEKKKSDGEDEAAAGGELLLWPDIFEASKPPSSNGLLPLAVAPEEGRLVLFSACRMPHAVAPSRRRRHCFTVWLSEGEEERRRRARAGTTTTTTKQGGVPDDARERVLSSAAGRRAVARVLLAPAWRRSLVAAHPPGPALDAALEEHDRDVRKLAEALKAAGVVEEEEEEVVGGGEARWVLSRRRDGGAAGSKGDPPMLWF